jgi:Zn-finger nucleic acid-binding protein
MTPESQGIEIDERRPGTLPCPVCGVAMHVERKERIEVHVCAEHGIWLDKGGIEQITNSVELRARIAERSIQRVAFKETTERAKLLGSAFGWWSFLFD